jgi:hypothetical protein
LVQCKSELPNGAKRLCSFFGEYPPLQRSKTLMEQHLERERVFANARKVGEYLLEGQDAWRSYTLSPSVEVLRVPTAPCFPHFQPLIAGMSSPCSSMYCL